MTDLDQKNLKQSESGDVKRQVKFCPVCRGNRWFTGNVCESAAEHPDMAPQAVAKAAAATQKATFPVKQQSNPSSGLLEQSSYGRGFNAGVERVAAMLDAQAPTDPPMVVEHLALMARKFKVGQ